MSERVPDKPAEDSDLPGAIERILFARVELWVVAVLLLLGCLLSIGFGAAVLDAERDKWRFGQISRTALAVAEIPGTLKKILKPPREELRASDKYETDPSGWSFPSGKPVKLSGYLLLSRYDGTESRQKVELVSLPAMRVVHTWTPLASELMKKVKDITHFEYHTNWDDKHFREIHPWIEETGDLIVKDYDSPLFRINPCGKPVWTLQSAIFHHSIEGDEDGNLWIPSVATKHTLANLSSKFRDDSIAKVSQSGKLLYSKSVAQILVDHGFANWLFSNAMFNWDAIHLNDIQPVMQDSKYWKKGDVFLSLRNLSTIMLYRPKTDEIVWMRRGPWISQHDVDIIDDHTIGIYDNAVQDRGGAPFFDDSSQIVFYDLDTHEVTRPLEKMMRQNHIKTWLEGLFTRLPDGSTLIEPSMDGRLLILNPKVGISATYLNRARDGYLYHLGWSRYIDQAKGDVIMRNLKKVRCNA